MSDNSSNHNPDRTKQMGGSEEKKKGKKSGDLAIHAAYTTEFPVFFQALNIIHRVSPR